MIRVVLLYRQCRLKTRGCLLDYDACQCQYENAIIDALRIAVIVELIEGRCCRCHCCRCRCFISVAVSSLLLMHSLFSVVVRHAYVAVINYRMAYYQMMVVSATVVEYIADRGPM